MTAHPGNVRPGSLQTMLRRARPNGRHQARLPAAQGCAGRSRSADGPRLGRLAAGKAQCAPVMHAARGSAAAALPLARLQAPPQDIDRASTPTQPHTPRHSPSAAQARNLSELPPVPWQT